MDAGGMAVPEMNFPRVVHLQELAGEALGGGCTWPRWPTRAGGGRRFVQKCSCYPQVLQRYRIYSNKDPRCNVQTLFYFCFLVSINYFFLRFSLRFVIKIKSDKHYLLFKIVVVMFLFCFGLFVCLFFWGFFLGGGVVCFSKIGISSIVFWNALTNIVLETKVDFVWKQTHFPLEVVTSADEQIL